MQTNGNRRIHWAGGFTLSEILITLVILGFIGALGVPMLGQQKVSKPLEVKSKHGTIECFWLNGQVKAWVSDNEDNSAGHFDDSLTDGNACYFTAPAASMYVLQAVGAGGTGADGLGGPSFYSTTVSQSGSIPTDQGFYPAIMDEKVPAWVRQYWNKIWEGTGDRNYISYTLTSPIGSSGSAVCKPVLKPEKECIELCNVEKDASFCTEGCRYDIEAKGGNSGKGGKVTVKSPIYFSENGQKDQVIYNYSSSDDVTLQIGGKSATLKSSGSGENAVCPQGTDVPTPGKNGADVNDASLVLVGDMKKASGLSLTRSQEGATGCTNETGKNSILGSIGKNNPANIQYYSQALAVNARFGLAGGPGSVKLKMLEKLPSNVQLKLQPAREGEKSIISIKNKNGGWDKIMVASSGAYGSSMHEDIPINDQNDLPFPKKYYPDSFMSSKPNLTIASGAGYTSYIATSGYIPGISGAGAHPIIDRVSGDDLRQFYVPSGWVKVESVKLKPITGSANAKCFDGSKPTNGACGHSNTTGTLGAAVVSW